MIIQFPLILGRFYCIGVMNYLKKIFLLTGQTNIQKLVITSLIDKKSCKKQKKDILKKMQ